MNAAILTFDTPTGPKRVDVAVALTIAEQVTGLSFSDVLPPDTGMLFLFGTPRQQKFWMFGVAYPLDMIFIGADGRVLYIEHNAPPDDRLERGPNTPVLGMLEVAGGWAVANNIDVGTMCSIEEA